MTTFEQLADGYDAPEAMLAAIGRIERGADGLVQFVFNGGEDIVRHLQIFVGREDDGSPFVELSFFPDDVCVQGDLARAFRSWAEGWCRLLAATRYYARYENASWTFGDLGPESGVFLAADAGHDEES